MITFPGSLIDGEKANVSPLPYENMEPYLAIKLQPTWNAAVISRLIHPLNTWVKCS